MTIQPTEIKDCFIIEPTIYEDERGYFYESFNKNTFLEKTGMNAEFVQDNQSLSKYGVVRGLHGQSGEHAQAKLVRVLKGEVLDVAVDTRKSSPSYGKVVCVKLNEANRRQLYIPRGCLHGFSVISEEALFFYKCDNFYNRESEIGVFPMDKHLNIDWQVSQPIISSKDQALSSWDEFSSSQVTKRDQKTK